MVEKSSIYIYNIAYIKSRGDIIMKKRKSLIITYIKILIVVAIIAAGIFALVKLFTKEYSSEEFETIKTDMLSIQGKTEVIAQKVEIKEKGAKYIGTKLADKEKDEKLQNLIDNKIIDLESKKSNYYYLDNENLKELGLENISIDDYYIVDYKKNDIIYVNGIEDENGNVVYKLSDMEQENNEDKESKENNTKTEEQNKEEK
jgi:hypothetical protein